MEGEAEHAALVVVRVEPNDLVAQVQERGHRPGGGFEE
jgi:hypothetical protein